MRAGGFSFAAIVPREGTYDWTTADAIMAETEARGISLDANVYGAPRWAQDTNRLARVGGHFKAHLVPPRPGTFGAFAERVAARYGTRIDYYELGNEWDLVPERIMTRDEAVRLHRGGYAGLRRGNPAVAVMSNGWTSPTVRPDHYGPDWMLGGEVRTAAFPSARREGTTDRFPSGGVTFFTYGTSVSGTPGWTFAGERGDLMRARDEKAARRYVFAAPAGSVIFVR